LLRLLEYLEAEVSPDAMYEGKMEGDYWTILSPMRRSWG
jgi:hypothetical protein